MPNYLPFLRLHLDFDEQSGAIVDKVGGLSFAEQLGVPADPDGIIGTARSFPNGTIGVNSDGFARTCLLNEPFDLTQQKVAKGVVMGWYRADSAAGNHQVFMEQTGNTEGEKAWAWDAVGNVAAKPGALYLFRDNAGGDWDWAFQVPEGGMDVAFPTGVWVFEGFTWSIPDDRTSGWLYTPSSGKYWESYVGAAAFGAPFNYTNRGITWIGANNAAGSVGTSGMLGDADHISVLHGIEFTQDDVEYFWRAGRARAYPRGFKGETRGGVPFYYS